MIDDKTTPKKIDALVIRVRRLLRQILRHASWMYLLIVKNIIRLFNDFHILLWEEIIIYGLIKYNETSL